MQRVEYGTALAPSDLYELSTALGLPLPESWLDGWNAIARRVGMLELQGSDTITSEEWNYAVDFALRLHA